MENLPLILMIAALIALQIFFMRRRNPERTQQELVVNLLGEVKINEVLVETFSLRQKPKKFEVTMWEVNKNRLKFLAKSVQRTLSEAFGMIEDFNQQIDAAKKASRKAKSASYKVDIDVNELKEPLARSRQGLEQWLLVTIGTKDPPPKYPSIIDYLFGGR